MINLEFSKLLDAELYQPTQNRNADFKVRAESRKDLSPAKSPGNSSCRPAEETTEAATTTLPCHGQSTGLDIIESALPPDSPVRLTTIATLPARASIELQGYEQGFELLVLQGDLVATCTKPDKADENNGKEKHHVRKGQYLRIPFGQRASFESHNGCTLLLKLGQMSETDRELRHICTNDQSLWLPGPADGTEVLPLHLHDTKSVLLIRWNEPAYFKPQLDPYGEELFVIEGTLHDAYGSYESGSWIRNPVPAWQAWGGHRGTLVYYKNGHFPAH